MLVAYEGKKPEIDKDVFVAENATIIGDVKIGKDSSVWFGAVIRGDEDAIRIGEGTNVQDNVVLHCDFDSPMNIGNRVTIGHGAVVHGATIGDNTLIGMGAVILNGAKIGSLCVIGAGAVVKENAIIPDRSLVVGVPGRVVGEVRPDYIDALRQEPYYIGLSKKYMNGAASE